MSNKERLENLNPTIVDNQGNVTLKGEDFHWLMEQAERVQEMENRLNLYDFWYRIAYEQNKRYREALEFYADESIYSARNKERAEITLDYGEKARQALCGE